MRVIFAAIVGAACSVSAVAAVRVGFDGFPLQAGTCFAIDSSGAPGIQGGVLLSCLRTNATTGNIASRIVAGFVGNADSIEAVASTSTAGRLVVTFPNCLIGGLSYRLKLASQNEFVTVAPSITVEGVESGLDSRCGTQEISVLVTLGFNEGEFAEGMAWGLNALLGIVLAILSVSAIFRILR